MALFADRHKISKFLIPVLAVVMLIAVFQNCGTKLGPETFPDSLNNDLAQTNSTTSSTSPSVDTTVTTTSLPQSPLSYFLNINPRRQWNANFGYCGEVSIITAGLKYGQYISQYDARAIASNNANQSASSSQLLIGVNAHTAASRMKLSYQQYSQTNQSSSVFLSWVKQQLVRDSVVLIGIFIKGLNDPDYDHIVPVIGMSSGSPIINATYNSSDKIKFSDNGLLPSPSNPIYFFEYTLSQFQLTRALANQSGAPEYSVKTSGNYGIAITGVLDPNQETLPVSIVTNLNFENPSMVNNSNIRPTAMALQLNVQVDKLVPGLSYRLYRYDNFDSVPTTDFNANSASAISVKNISVSSGSSFTFTENIMSDEIVIYRAVRAP